MIGKSFVPGLFGVWRWAVPGAGSAAGSGRPGGWADGQALAGRPWRRAEAGRPDRGDADPTAGRTKTVGRQNPVRDGLGRASRSSRNRWSLDLRVNSSVAAWRRPDVEDVAVQHNDAVVGRVPRRLAALSGSPRGRGPSRSRRSSSWAASASNAAMRASIMLVGNAFADLLSVLGWAMLAIGLVC